MASRMSRCCCVHFDFRMRTEPVAFSQNQTSFSSLAETGKMGSRLWFAVLTGRICFKSSQTFSAVAMPGTGHLVLAVAGPACRLGIGVCCAVVMAHIRTAPSTGIPCFVGMGRHHFHRDHGDPTSTGVRGDRFRQGVATQIDGLEEARFAYGSASGRPGPAA